MKIIFLETTCTPSIVRWRYYDRNFGVSTTVPSFLTIEWLSEPNISIDKRRNLLWDMRSESQFYSKTNTVQTETICGRHRKLHSFISSWNFLSIWHSNIWLVLKENLKSNGFIGSKYVFLLTKLMQKINRLLLRYYYTRLLINWRVE